MAGKGKSNFLPERVSGALKSLAQRIFGACVFVVALWAVFAMLMYNPYLDGFGVASTFGTQSVMGYLVGMVRYAVGVIPGLFLFLCIARWGMVNMIGVVGDNLPEYNLLRGFIALCMGAIGFGLIAPQSVYGGMFGSVASADIVFLVGSVASFLIGLLCLGVFFVMGGMLLHVKWAHVRWGAKVLARWGLWLASAFHLIKYVPKPVEEDEVEENT